MNRLLRAATTMTVALHLVTPLASAQTAAVVPLYKVNVVANTDSGVFANIFNLHILSGGGLLVVDAVKRRLLVLDSTLKKFKIAADTAPGAPPYGMGQGGLVPFIGDSAAFIEQSSQALIAVDKNGKFGRISALPRPTDMRFLGGPTYGKPGFDIKGRLYYRAALPGMFPAIRENLDTTFADPDSAPVIRVDLDSRAIDTLAWMRVPALRMKTFRLGGSTSCCQSIINPLPVIDDWAYDRDGTVAIVRGQDYHIDWILPNGTKKSTPKMPIDWRKITDDEKQRMVDSIARNLDSVRTALVNRIVADAQRRGTVPRLPSDPTSEVVKPAELPEYYPAVKATSRPRFDLEGNLWVIPGTSLLATPDGGLVYDVVNREGALVKRVQLPNGRVLSGFAPGGIVYMTVIATPTNFTRIERALVVRAS